MSSTHSLTPNTLNADQFWSPVYVNALICRDYNFNGSGGIQVSERVYAIQDANYNVTALLSRFTHLGDGGEENGMVDAQDLSLVTNNWHTSVSGGDVMGDFNHDGYVDITDQTIVTNNWNANSSSSSWHVTERLTYDAYGNFTVKSFDDTGTLSGTKDFLAWDYTFQGGRWDGATGLVDFQNRPYSVSMMRFVRTDPLGYVNGVDDYLIEGANPLNRLDPTGLQMRRDPLPDGSGYGPWYDDGQSYSGPGSQNGGNALDDDIERMTGKRDRVSFGYHVGPSPQAIEAGFDAVNNGVDNIEAALENPGTYLKDVGESFLDGRISDEVQGAVERGTEWATFGLVPASGEPDFGYQDDYDNGKVLFDVTKDVETSILANAALGAMYGEMLDLGVGTEPTGMWTSDTGCGVAESCFTAGTKILTNTGKVAIEQVQIGQRVMTRPSGMEELDHPQIDPAGFRVLRLESINVKTQDILHIALLRPVSKLGGLGPGDTIPMNILELETEGTARVLAIEPCPPIDNGRGELVTGTITHDNMDVRTVKFEGSDELLEPTGLHPLYSEDRLEFVQVRDLHIGERIRTRTGTAVVESLGRKYGTHQVFNLEIGRVHQYYVSELEVLAHNECPNGGYTDYQHGNADHDAAINEAVGNLPAGASQIRKNQAQVDINGNIVGNNRPDLQYDLNGEHYNVEFDHNAARSNQHWRQIRTNDPNSWIIQVFLGG